MSQSTSQAVSDDEGWKHFAPFAGSLMLHTTLLLGMALVVIPDRQGSERLEILTAIADQEPARPELEVIAVPVLQASASDSSPGVTATNPSVSQIGHSEQDATPRSELAPPLDLSLTGMPAGALVAGVGESTGRSGGGIGVGNAGDGGTGGNGKFFGTKVEAESVVFVVDNSGSMSAIGRIDPELRAKYPRLVMSRMQRVKLELSDAIDQMSEKQRFFVIFFNTYAVPMPANQLLPATPPMKQAFANWVADIGPQGGTNPEAAMLMALKLRPQAIYFLTDGLFNGTQVVRVTAANQTRIPIHTICFGDKSGEKLMEAIAESSGGTYRFIPDGIIVPE